MGATEMYGRSDEDWDELVRVGHNFLIDVARRRRYTTYTELDAVLRRRTGLRGFDFNQVEERAALGYLLGRIVDEDRKLNPSLMISSLVIYLNANDAGSGFYAKAREVDLLKDGMDKDEFWIRQVKAVHERYGRTHA